MSGFTSVASATLPAQRSDQSDGLAAAASDALEPVGYPNRLDGIAVIGRTGAWERSFLLRPKFGGRFLFLLHPARHIDVEAILRRSVHFPNFNSAPKVLTVRIPLHLREYEKWSWRLVKTTFNGSPEDDLEVLESAEQPGDGLLDPVGGAALAQAAELNHEFSRLLFETRPALDGDVSFAEERDRMVSRIVAWSCHQPYESEGGSAKLANHSEAILEWYRDEVESFEPHRVWALGDTCYSDGTGALNFVNQIYDRPGWPNNVNLRKDLLSLYRLNYRYHWSFEPMQRIMRSFSHIAMWDDHEIRDGYGSDEHDFVEGNRVMKEIASQAAEEYLFSWGERLRSESARNLNVDNHLAYVDDPVAAFVFDGRNSRRYGPDLPLPADIPLFASLIVGVVGGGLAAGPVGLAAGSSSAAATVAVEKQLIDLYRWHNPGEVISDQQLADFERFCNHIRDQPRVRYLMLGNCVPFIYVNDIIEALASELEIMATSTGKHARDDIRDSWHSPGNRRQLSKLLDILRRLHTWRPDMEMINISGDIHLSNAFTYQPPGFAKPLYQITTSPLTNRGATSEFMSNLVSVEGTLGFVPSSDDFGDVYRLWHEATYQNFLTVEATSTNMIFHLHVFNADDDVYDFGGRDVRLTITPGKGYRLD